MRAGAFIHAWDRRRQLRSEANPEAWVRTTAYRPAVSHWRRSRLFARAADPSIRPTPPREPSPDRVAIDRALARLPDDQRRAIVLFHMADLSIADIALETGSPAGTVKARLSRARAALSAFLSEESAHA